MLFQEDHISQIKSGEKTQTRRQWDSPKVKEGGVYIASTDMFTSHDEADCYIRVLRTRAQKLGGMAEGEAYAEGYESLAAFREAWEDINDTEWDPDEQVTVVEFEYAGDEKSDDDAP